MALPIYRYPLDKTGENPDNFVNREPHSLTPMARPTDVRVAAPIYGPFFGVSIVVRDQANGAVLVKDVDYKITDLLQDPTMSFGQEIGQFIVIQNGNVSNEIDISYQVLGGNYQNDATAIQHVFQTFMNDTRPVDWNDISGKPSTFPPSLHLHFLEDVIGWGPMIVALDNVRDAILLNNTPMFESMIDWINRRKTPWANITDAPTFIDVVVKSREIKTEAGSGLKGGGDLGVDLSLSLTNTGVAANTYGSSTMSAVLTVDAQGRITAATAAPNKAEWDNIENKPTTLTGLNITGAVADTRSINTPVQGGITGGGRLNGDLYLELLDVPVNVGTWGGPTKIPSVEVDSKGRVVNIYENDLPTTVSGLGITDAVDTVSAQEISGLKSFEIVKTGEGSTARNLHNEDFSEIVSKDFLEQQILSTGTAETTVLRFGNCIVQAGVISIPEGEDAWINGDVIGNLEVAYGPKVMTLSNPIVVSGLGATNEDTISMGVEVVGNEIRIKGSGPGIDASSTFSREDFGDTKSYCFLGWVE